jgi:adenosylhomocysteine nucleosidase
MVGILFATKMEAQPFLDLWGGAGGEVSISGMGMAAARIAAEELVEKGATQIINAGVCGALNDSLKRGSVYRISRVSVDEASCLVVENSGLRLITVDKPVFEPDRKKELAKHADLVDMEGYAVARVCKENGIPCIMVKGVTDFGDGNGKADIKKHITPVSQAVAEEVLRCL